MTLAIEASEERNAARATRNGRLYVVFACGFGAFTFIMAVLSALGVPDRIVGALLALFTAGLFLFIAACSGTMKVREFFAVGRRVPPPLSGMAMAAGGVGAGSFTAMVAALYVLGYAGFAFVLGAAGAFMLSAALIVPYLRRSGAYTLPDFLSARYGVAVRLLGVLLLIGCTFPALVAQLHGFGTLLSGFLGLGVQSSIYVGLVLAALCTVLGGMRSVTWTQVAQYLVLVIAILLPALWILSMEPGMAMSDLAYGRPLPNVSTESAGLAGIAYASEAYSADFWLLALCLMVGGASLPQLATRAVAAPDALAARSSFGWGLLFTAVLCFAAPLFAGMARWAVQGGMPDTPHPDLVAGAVPLFAGMPFIFTALTTVGLLSALLAATAGLLITAGNSLGQDIFFRTLAPAAPASSRLIVARILMLGLGIGAIYVAERQEFDFLTLMSWSFALAASGFFPAIVLGIWWPRANAFGAALGMLAGAGVTLFHLVGTRYYAAELSDILAWLPRLGDLTIAALGVPVGFVVAIAASLATRKPSPMRQEFVQALHRPNGDTVDQDPAA